MELSMGVVIDSRSNKVIWWKIADSDVIEELLDEAAEEFRTSSDGEPENDLKDDLWVEDEVYDYQVIPLGEGDTKESVFKQRGWKE